METYQTRLHTDWFIMMWPLVHWSLALYFLWEQWSSIHWFKFSESDFIERHPWAYRESAVSYFPLRAHFRDEETGLNRFLADSYHGHVGGRAQAQVSLTAKPAHFALPRQTRYVCQGHVEGPGSCGLPGAAEGKFKCCATEAWVWVLSLPLNSYAT